MWAYGMVLYVRNHASSSTKKLIVRTQKHKEIITHKLPYFDQLSDVKVIHQITSGNFPVWSAEETVQ